MQKGEGGSPHYIERREDRTAYGAYARARHGYRRAHPKIVDLSANGVKLWTDGHFLPGKTIWLSLPTLAAKDARVVWDNGHLIGCEFSQPLHPAVLDHIVQEKGKEPSSSQTEAVAVRPMRSVA